VTSAVTEEAREELFADHPDRRLSMVFESFSYTSLEAFQRDAEAWLKDRSELGWDVYPGIEWHVLYEEFKDWVGK
jgi:hypothetical protein